MIELECPTCESTLLVPPTVDALDCRACAITVPLADEDDQWALPLAA
jgi:hypothetical protein